MDVSNVSREDVITCAQLIEVIKKARFDGMTAQDAEALIRTSQWVQSVAVKMANSLKEPAVVPVAAPVSPATDQTMKIKSMGPIGSAKPVSKKKK